MVVACHLAGTTFTYKTRYKYKELILPLYKSLVRPHLEHAMQFWSPNLRRDIDKIEKIQRRATKMIPEIRNHSYHQQIYYLDLISLVQRRLRGQLIEVFEYLNEFTTASLGDVFWWNLVVTILDRVYLWNTEGLHFRMSNYGWNLVVTIFGWMVEFWVLPFYSDLFPSGDYY